MIRIFSRLLDNNKKLPSKEILGCTLSSTAGKVITGSEFIESKMAECDKYMVILQAACNNHYDVYEFCSKALSKYITDRELNGSG